MGGVSSAREYHLAIQWGFVEVARDVVTVLADVAELPSEIDVAAARTERRRRETSKPLCA